MDDNRRPMLPSRRYATVLPNKKCVHIPYRMPLGTQALRAVNGKRLRGHVTKYVRSLPVPTNLRSYYGITMFRCLRCI